jgi:hypothetical protein
MDKRQENSLKSLVNLYTVVIGVALSSAVVQLIDPQKGLASINLKNGALFLAFVITLMPFYHGALRHLDDAYLENPNSPVKDGALIVDFLLLFLHGLVFVVLSLMFEKPSHFAWIVTAILIIDVVWGVFAYFASASGEKSAVGKWVIINLITVLVAGLALYSFDISLSYSGNVEKLALAISVVCILRTLADYCLGWRFYFPK